MHYSITRGNILSLSQNISGATFRAMQYFGITTERNGSVSAHEIHELLADSHELTA